MGSSRAEKLDSLAFRPLSKPVKERGILHWLGSPFFESLAGIYLLAIGLKLLYFHLTEWGWPGYNYFIDIIPMIVIGSILVARLWLKIKAQTALYIQIYNCKSGKKVKESGKNGG